MTMTIPDAGKLLELAAMCEAASGPDRDIDVLLAPLQGLRIVQEGHPLGRCVYDANGHGVPLPSYTRSLDAAMSLVPKGLFPTMDFETVRCWLRKAGGFDVEHGPAYGFAVTMPLALCAAALRARAASSEPAIEGEGR
jgi:hypothetical protein